MPQDDTIYTKLAVLINDMTYLKEKLSSVDNKVSSNYVSKEEFAPVRNIVFGLVGLILVAVVGALISLILR